jgi:photosystem II stability/assembly factor-like uncharacterized protein
MKKTFLLYALLPFAMLAKAQWETVNPTPPLATYKSVVHISGEKYAATGGTAIMLTNNSGETWQQAALEGAYYFNSVFFVDDETGYAGGYDGVLLKTTDGGIHWEQLNCGIDDELYDIYFVNRDIGFIAAEYGVVLKTTDGGANWVKKTVNGEYSDLFTIKFYNTSTGYASGDNGTLWKTTDSGENWTVTDLDFWDVYDLHVINENTIIAASDDGIFKSTDGGANWSLKFQPGPKPIDWVVYRLSFVDENIGFATGKFNEIYKTVDGGDNWTAITLPAEYELDGYFPGIAFESANKGIIGDYSCFYSVDLTSNTWKQFKKSFTSKFFEAVAFSNDTTVFAVGSNIIARSKNNGRTWVEIQHSNNIAGAFYDVFFTSNTTGYVVGYNHSLPGDNKGLILKTTNGGDSWEMVYNPAGSLRAIHFPSSDVGYAVGMSSQLFKTTDGGTNWTSVNTGIDANLSSVFFTSSSTGYTCGATGKIYKTTDGGNTWTLQNSGVTNYLYDILFTNDLVGYAVDSRKTLLNTTDGGNTWNKKIPSARPMLQLYSICFTTPDKGTIVGERGMLIETTDGGQNWEISNLPFYDNVKGVASGNPHTTIAVGWYGTIFRKYTGPEEYPISDGDNGGTTNIVVDNAWSFNVFPNPFSNSITIEGLKTSSQNIHIQLFDMSGILVHDEKTDRINNEAVTINTSNLKTGVFLLRITDGINHYTRKILKKD